MPKNPLLRLLLINTAGGALIGLLFALGLFALDAGRLQTLILRDQAGMVAFMLLAAGFATTCAGLSAATAVMSDASYAAERGRRGKRR